MAVTFYYRRAQLRSGRRRMRNVFPASACKDILPEKMRVSVIHNVAAQEGVP